MAKIRIPKNKLEARIRVDEKFLDTLSMMGIPAEISGEEVEIEIFPNRPDLLSIQGLLRAYNLFTGKRKTPKEYKIQKSNQEIHVDKGVEKLRPYSMAAIVKGVKFDDEKIKEIMQWQEKIHSTIGRNRKKVAIGYYILNKVKFPVKYTAKTPKDIIFEPLDMPEKMNALKILSRHPCGREFGEQLKGFDKFPVYYDSNNEVLSMPPIINSNNSGKIIPGTTDVLIECSGTDLNTLKKVTSLAVIDLIDEGGKAYSVDIAYGNKKESINLKPEKIKLSLENTNRLLGLSLKENDLQKLLAKMGYECKNNAVLVPAYRTDILHEVDIIEDIAIAYGYDDFIPEIPKLSTIGEQSPKNNIISKISEILAGLGYIECSSLHLIKQDEAKTMKIQEPIELIDSKTDYKLLRPNLLTPILRILAENKDNEYPQKVFEIGKVFSRDKHNRTETGIQEQENLIIASTPSNFTELKQALDCLLKNLGLHCTIEETTTTQTIEGRTGKIKINNKPIGYIGETHPETLRAWNLKLPLAIAELSLEEIFNILIKSD